MCLGVGRRLHLDQPLDLEAVRAQERDPLAVTEMELDADLPRPLEAVHAELRPLQRRRRRALVDGAEDDERRVAEERRAGRRDEAAAPPPGSTGTDRPRSTRRTRRRRGRSSHREGLSPPASASTSGNEMPVFACMRRAVSSCAGVMSTPTGRAPSFASHAEKYAVPQPSSTTSSPATSPRTFSSDSSTPQTPHEISSSAQFVSAFSSV